METLQKAYSIFIEDLPGHVFFMGLVKSQSSSLFLINTAHPNYPKYELDWFYLNHMNNVSDVIIQTSKNTSTDANLHVFPASAILNKFGFEVINKKRLAVITTTSPESINFNSSLFNDPVEILLYSSNFFYSNFEVLPFFSFSFDQIRQAAEKILKKDGKDLAICLQCGASLFNILMKEGQKPVYLFLTVFEGDENESYLAGELDMAEVKSSYRLVFESQTTRDDFGLWKTCVFKLID